LRPGRRILQEAKEDAIYITGKFVGKREAGEGEGFRRKR